MAYATRQDLFRLGLAASAFTISPRAVVVDPSTDILKLSGHGLTSGDVVRLEAQGTIGGVAAELPGGIVAGTSYAVDVLGFDTFRLSGVDITSTGTGVTAFVLDMDATIDAELEAQSGHIDIHLVAYTPPILGPPNVLEVLKLWTCHLAAFSLAITRGLAAPAYAEKMASYLEKRAISVEKHLEKLTSGGTLPGLPIVDQTPGVEERAVSAWGNPDRDWADAAGGYLLR